MNATDFLKKKPSFCIITPTSYLSQFAMQSHTHLVLAHLVDKDNEYASFYEAMSARGDFVMMDNSSYERKIPFSPDRLVELGKRCGAHAIVLPDYPFRPGHDTIAAAMEFIPQFKDAGFLTFFVPQSMKNDTTDWIHTYSWAVDNPNIDIIGMSILGIPNAISWCDPSYARVVMSQMLIERGVFNFNKHHHYLGLNSGVALEIPTLLNMKALDTIDSSGPLWCGILGHSYTPEADSYLQIKKPKMPVDFSIPMTKDTMTIMRIQHNIDMTLSLFNAEKPVDTTWYAQE